MSKYIVWVGGIADYEGNSKAMAEAIAKEWLDEGYDDVIVLESEA